MKFRKRIISIGFAAVMAINTVIPAFAGQNDGGTTCCCII